MGRSHGTGYPVFFLCSKCRKSPCTRLYRQVINGRESTGIKRCDHNQRRTGRIRPLASSQRGKGSNRALQVRHEYVCDCGHKGWTRHKGVLKCPLIEEVENGQV